MITNESLEDDLHNKMIERVRQQMIVNMDE
jgi:hypothetical protein